MQSSPPTRAWERPSSPARSQYSLDLGALDLDSDSDRSTPRQHVDRVFSEDIDGPSDFTLNMGKWMKGGTLGKGTATRPRSVLQTLRDQGVESPRGDSDGAESPATSVLKLERPTASNHTPTGSPPKESVWRGSRQEEPDDSEWDPYSERSTPKPPVHRELQPTVEDYYSEIMPAHFQFAHSSGSKSKLGLEDETEARASSPTLSPIRSPLTKRTMNQGNDLEAQLKQLQTRCLQLETLNNTLGQALKEERRKRTQEAEAHKSYVESTAHQISELTEVKDDAIHYATKLKRELVEQKALRSSHNSQLEPDSEQIQKLKDEHVASQQVLKDVLESNKSQHARELSALQQEYDLVCLGRDAAEEAARWKRTELEAIELGRMPSPVEQTRPPFGTANDMKPHTRAVEADTASAQEELALLKQAREQDGKRAEMEKQLISQHAMELRKNLKDLKKQLLDEQVAHDAELLRLEIAPQEPVNAASSELDELRQELEAKQSLLNDLTIDRDAAQDDLEMLRADLEATKSKLANAEAVSKAMDTRISDAMRKRESYWRGRLAEEEQERIVMAQALLHQWGREEVGINAPQGYRFKFVDRKSDMKA